MTGVKKKVSKKNKSSWRKYVNIKDVEDFLEEKREEERIGSVASKTNEELFTVDTLSTDKILTPRQKRKLSALRPPKNISVLENTSKVEDPLVQRNRVKLKKNGRNLFDEIANPEKSRRVAQAVEDRRKYYEKLDKRTSSNKCSKTFRDIWDEREEPIKVSFLSNEWFTKDLALHNLNNIGKPVVKVHDSVHHKTSLAKSIEPPHPGTSYNPSLKDHQNLLEKVIEKESEIIKEEKHLKRVTTDMFNKMTEEERNSSWIVEMSSGLSTEENDKKVDCEENNDDYVSDTQNSANPPVKNKKKDKKARKKQKEQRELLQQMKLKKEQRKKITDIHRLKHISAEVLEEMKSLEKAKERRRRLKEKMKYEPKRISKVKYQEPEIDVNMAEDIAGNLRNVKPETSLLIERFKEFQRRNILPPSVDLGPRKRRKVKRFVRSSHKETEVK